MITLGQKIKDKLLEKNLSQKELANKLELPESTISALIKDKYEPGIFKIRAIADFLNVSIDWLMGGDEALGLGGRNIQFQVARKLLLNISSSQHRS